MLPGLIAGRFDRDECVIDLRRLARAAGARFVAAEVTGLERGAGEVLLAGDRLPLRGIVNLADAEMNFRNFRIPKGHCQFSGSRNGIRQPKSAGTCAGVAK